MNNNSSNKKLIIVLGTIMGILIITIMVLVVLIIQKNRGIQTEDSYKKSISIDKSNNKKDSTVNEVAEAEERSEKCDACRGTGTVYVTQNAGRTPCAICGGTGVQQEYVANLYYDASLGWQGGYITVGCGGCGGAGYINNGTQEVGISCPDCGGKGYK